MIYLLADTSMFFKNFVFRTSFFFINQFLLKTIIGTFILSSIEDVQKTSPRRAHFNSDE